MRNSGSSRRDFLKQSAMVGLSSFLPHGLMKASLQKPPLEIHLFSKHLQFLDYGNMAKAAAEIGFDGVDLTVRPGGHVAPENVSTDLPKATQAIWKAGLKSSMMTTAVTDAQDKTSQRVLKTASDSGIEFYRMGYLHYDEDNSVMDSMADFQTSIKEISELNKELGLIGCYQNHAGHFAGASIWEIDQMLSKAGTTNMGSQYDIRHALVEGGLSWETALRLIHPRIKTIALKDYKWGQVDGQWKVINTPIGEGMVDFQRYFSLLKTYNINVPASLHYEYPLGGVEHGATQITESEDVIYGAMKKDLTALRDLWERA
ncbi:MAG: TIM barrel protein [Balneolales bacterium]